MRKILFVCTGNTCRSPMAQSIFSSKAKALAIKEVKVFSAGIMCYESQTMSANAQEALKAIGVKPVHHKSTQFRLNMIEEYDLILTMTDRHKTMIGDYENVFSLSEFTGSDNIEDPYGRDVNVYINCAKQLDMVLEKVINRLNFK